MVLFSLVKHIRRSTPFLIYRLIRHLRVLRYIQLVLVVILMLISALGDTLSVGLVFPFLELFEKSSDTSNNQFLNILVDWFGFDFSSNKSVLIFSICFCLVVAISAIIRIFTTRTILKFSARISTDLSTLSFSNLLKDPFVSHISRNSSEVINTIIMHIGQSSNSITQSLQIIASSITIVFIVIALYGLAPQMTIVSGLSIAALYSFIFIILRPILHRNSKELVALANSRLKTIMEGFGSIRDVILSNNYAAIVSVYSNYDYKQRGLAANNQFYGLFPRYSLEAFSIIAIISVSTYHSSLNNSESFIPTLGLFALAMQKLIPAVQQIYGSYSSINATKSSLEKALNSISNSSSENNEPDRQQEALISPQKLTLSSVSLNYPGRAELALNLISLDINKGEKIGFIGETGSGKSTAFDLLMGLLDPSKGVFLIDSLQVSPSTNLSSKRLKRSYQNSISHVPQSIYLSDSSIAENIAFGEHVDRIDNDRMILSAKRAHIHELIMSMPNTYQNLVGERGVKLSGGQRQRIGIARALYKNSQILFLDEATSALDEATESKVMSSILNSGPNVTIIMIAHRKSTLASCDRIYLFSEGKIIQSGLPHQIL